MEVHTCLNHWGYQHKGEKEEQYFILAWNCFVICVLLAIVEGAKNIFAPLCIQVVKWEGTFAVARGSWPLFFFICN